LPAPFSTFQALNLDDAADFQRLLGIVADELSLPEPKRFDVPALVDKVKEADRNVVTSNPAFLPADEIKRRLNAVQLSVRLDQGTGQWFILLVENESAEEIEIEEMVLQTKDGHRLASPARPKPPEAWKL
jgi:hypothetical protein